MAHVRAIVLLSSLQLAELTVSCQREIKAAPVVFAAARAAAVMGWLHQLQRHLASYGLALEVSRVAAVGLLRLRRQLASYGLALEGST